MPGTPFGPHRLADLTDHREMCDEWQVPHNDRHRIVAIPLPARLSENGRLQRRFRRETHPAPRLNSPNFVPSEDYGQSVAAPTSIEASPCVDSAPTDGSSSSVRHPDTAEHGAPRMLQGVRV